MAIVERINARGISGWVAHERGDNIVVVRVNGLEVANFRATREIKYDGEPREFGFRRRLADLWDYLGTDDAVTVEHAGQRLPIAGRGLIYHVDAPGEKSFQELSALIADGWAFDRHGHFGAPGPRGGKTASFHGKTPALVERIGARVIRGWVAHGGTAGNVVTVNVNGVQVASTTASREMPFSGEVKDFGFSRTLGGLWEYLGTEDEVTVEHNGHRIPIVGHGMVYRTETGADKTFDELAPRLSHGWMFDKKGRLTRPFGRSRKVRVFGTLFDEVQSLVHDALDLTLFPTYGTLLGCVREGGFIAHDNDIDVTYVSRHETADGVKKEYLDLCDLLIDAGYQGLLQPYGLGIKRPILMDIYPSWIKDGKYDISWGYHGEPVEWTPEMAELSERRLGPLTVKVPRGSEALLAQIYGENWRVPDPGFSHYSPTRKFDPEYQPTYLELQRIFWKQYYKNNTFSEESAFSRFVARQIDGDALVIDIGCGSGRDLTYFVSAGHPSIGVDASPEGIRQGQERAMPNCHFHVLDVNDADALDELFAGPDIVAAQNADRQIVIYLRFFLHAIPGQAERSLFDAIARNLPKLTLAAEFRTERDAALPKFNAKHYRRFVDAAAVAGDLRETYDFDIDYLHEGTGLSVYEGEDPFLCRIIANRRPEQDGLGGPPGDAGP